LYRIINKALEGFVINEFLDSPKDKISKKILESILNEIKISDNIGNEAYFSQIMEEISLYEANFLESDFINQNFENVVTKSKEKYYVEENLNDFLKFIKSENLENYIYNSIKLKVNDIIFIQADVNYTKIHFVDGSTEIKAITIKLMEKIMNQINKKLFIRIHKSFLINLKYVESFKRFEIILNGQLFPVSRRKYNNVKKAISVFQQTYAAEIV